jgi:drug/metabolite transporter (DMT)-like permease
MSLLMLLAAVYIIASAGEVWLFGWLGQYSIKLPILSAIIQNASWPLQLANYRYESSLLSQSRVITRHMLFSYGFLGCLAIFISMSKVIGLTSLPPILYVICANTEVVFQAILTKLILSKNITKLQLVSIVLVIIGFSITISHTLSVNARDIPFNQLCLGVIMSLLSRLCSSLNNVFAERYLFQ